MLGAGTLLCLQHAVASVTARCSGSLATSAWHPAEAHGSSSRLPVFPATLTPPFQAHKAVKQAESKIRQLREALADESARKEVRLSVCADVAM